MQDFQQRVIDEKKALDEKMNKLDAFLDAENRMTISEEEEERLKKQYNIMIDYSEILAERIAAFN